MSNPEMTKNRWLALAARHPKLAGGLALLIVGLGFWALTGGPQDSGTANLTFAVRRGPLPITVLISGEIKALKSQEIRSEVRGYEGVKILSIVEEGTMITPQDIEDKMVLVELDSSSLKDKITNQKIQVESSFASLVESENSFGIQKIQNQTDIQAAVQKAKFALMDFSKYLGDEAATEITVRRGLILTEVIERSIAEARARRATPPAHLEPEPNTPPPPSPDPLAEDRPPTLQLVDAAPETPDEPQPPERPDGPEPLVINLLDIDFARYADESLLSDGEAKQKLRELTDKKIVAETDQVLKKTELEGTQKLFERSFVTQTELDRAKVAFDKSALDVKSSATALELFKKYELPKQAEELFSKYEEALRSLEKTVKESESKLAQAEAKWKSAQARYNIESEQLNDLLEQESKCVILADTPGLVVYAEQHRWGGGEPIKQGSTVRERQRIITIPDMTEMSVEVKIHESHINKVKKAQRATIHVDAFEDQVLSGEVSKVAVLPDSEDRWMNPDLKVYEATIKIDGVHDWVKPGMSAEVEIKVTELENVIHVPIQSVTSLKGERVCYIHQGGEPEKRVVKTGEYNDQFIVIEEGLAEGELVLLTPPDTILEQQGEEFDLPEAPDQDSPEEEAAAPSKAPPAGARS